MRLEMMVITIAIMVLPIPSRNCLMAVKYRKGMRLKTSVLKYGMAVSTTAASCPM